MPLGWRVRLLDINPTFLASDGTIPNSNMADQLHPSRTGDQARANTMQPKLEKMML